MKKRMLMIAGILLIALLAVTAVSARALLLGDDPVAEAGQVDPDSLTAVKASTSSRAVVADATLVPLEHAALSMAANGLVAEVLVQEGEQVTAGQVILRLRDEQQRAALAQAEASVASAQAQLSGLLAGARAPEIAAAQATLDGAQAALARLQETPRTEDVAAARAAVAAADAVLERLYKGPDENARIAADAELSNAEAVLASAQAAYDLVAGEPNIAMLPQSVALQQATNNYHAAKARYDALFAPPEVDRVAQARAQLKQAEANLSRLLRPATAAEIAAAEAGVRQAQAQLDLLEAGAREQEIAAAAATVDQAEAARQLALASLADTELRAPFAGTLASLNVRVGEQVAAGMPIAELADLSAWQIETDDLTELDVVRVQEGQTVTLTFDAIPGLELAGTVIGIQPIGREKLGDITYKVVVHPAQADPRLRWNMTAVVTMQ
jgi:HlyD family secretion protein